YMDVVASLYGRNNLSELISRTAQNVFVPITVGGGIRSVEDVQRLLRSGADKVAINTAAIANSGLIKEVSNRFGSQCMVLSIEAKKVSEGKWEAFTDNGRERSGLDVHEWVQQAVELGAGEVLLTSIDQEGTRNGFDLELTRSVSEIVSVPVIASGGMGSVQDLFDVVQQGKADAVAMADILHYDRMSLVEIRNAALAEKIHVRQV
ncbi:MAG: imidazole glycerol phosphate synthase subunit HisF, partial [Planctomycetaceae bacterium]|nr:imidazole glycerol phosphate synthase subunit HisF [Planctomycetaceae bacterium]